MPDTPKPALDPLDLDVIFPTFTLTYAYLEYLVGRRTLASECWNLLQRAGSSLVIYGERGVGKSSFARLLAALCSDGREVSDRLGIESPLLARRSPAFS